MKRLIVAAVAAIALLAASGAEARGHRGSVVTTTPGIDPTTLLLLGTMGASGGASGVLPLALLAGSLSTQSTVVTRGRRR